MVLTLLNNLRRNPGMSVFSIALAVFFAKSVNILSITKTTHSTDLILPKLLSNYMSTYLRGCWACWHCRRWNLGSRGPVNLSWMLGLGLGACICGRGWRFKKAGWISITGLGPISFCGLITTSLGSIAVFACKMPMISSLGPKSTLLCGLATKWKISKLVIRLGRLPRSLCCYL